MMICLIIMGQDVQLKSKKAAVVCISPHFPGIDYKKKKFVSNFMPLVFNENSYGFRVGCQK